MIYRSTVLLQGIQVAAIYTVKEFLCSVSHCCDNVTCPLSQRDVTGSSTEEYDVDDVNDNIQLPVSSITTPTVTALASRDVCCLNAPRVHITLVQRGHAKYFCQQCIDTFISTNSNCPIILSRCNIYCRPVLQLDVRQC